MCDPISATIVGVGLLGGMAASKLMAPDVQAPTPPQAPKPTQQPTAADADTYRARNRNAENRGAFGGYGSTLLTGPQGANPLTGNLGTSTLLGQ